MIFGCSTFATNQAWGMSGKYKALLVYCNKYVKQQGIKKHPNG
jgi:hypothetical protein